jgi:hypothetical protein
MIIGSIRNGLWSDPTVWEGGKVPTSTDEMIVDTELTIDKSVIAANKISGRKGGINIIADNTKFIGGGHSPYDIPVGQTQPLHVTDVGLWIFGGQADIQGTPKTAWIRLNKGLIAGDTKFSATVVGWEVGDDLEFSPTAIDSADFSQAKITAINGNEIVFTPLPRAHPANTDLRSGITVYPEVLNLTRKGFYINGRVDNGSHILINSAKPQFIKHVLFQHMGARKEQAGNDDRKEFVLGRYPIHFHHSGNGSRGSEITGNVCIDCPSHCYVPHGSNGIYFKDNISHRTIETPFWVDLFHASHDVTYDHNFVGDTKFIPGSKNIGAGDGIPLGDLPPNIAVNGFEMGMGTGLVAIDNCVAGMTSMSDAKSGGAYKWEANNEQDAWVFKGNRAHNNFCNYINWQNSRVTHLIEDFIVYNALPQKDDNDGLIKRFNMFNGAYGNDYRFKNVIAFGGLVDAKAASLFDNATTSGYGQSWDSCIFEEFVMVQSPLKSEAPTLLINCKIGKIVDDAGGNTIDNGELAVHNLDVVNCVFDSIALGPNAGPTETIRVQNPDGTAYKITKAGKVTIPKFYTGTITPPPPPPPATITYSNVQKSQTYNCPTGTTGNPYTYIVPAGKYTYTTTDAEDPVTAQKKVDDQAAADIAANGQIEANKNLVCTPVAPPPVTVTAKGKSKFMVEITADGVADYRLTNAYNNMTPWASGTTIAGTIMVDMTAYRTKSIYLWINGKRIQKVIY